MITDPIADFLTIIRNGIMAGHESVNIPASKEKIRVTEILKDEGYINNFKVIKDHKQGTIRVFLKYIGPKKNAILGLKRVSKPGKRVHLPVKDLPRVLRGMGIAIISTNRGILTDSAAREANSGGEVLCYVW